MFARVSAVFGERPNAMVVPEEAIVPQGGRSFVVKVVAGPNKDELMSERVAVKIGLRQPGKVEILEGLTLEDTVVVAGQQRLQKDGTLVKVVDLSKAGGPNAAKPPEPASGKPAEGGPGKPADKPITAAPAAKQAAAKPVTGDNPCLRGLNATR
jgi:membrane fusion protein (multidrug efflux system)